MKLAQNSMLGGAPSRLGRMANKRRICYSLAVKRCRVSFQNGDVEHAVEVEACSVYDAVGLAMLKFQRAEFIGFWPTGTYVFNVETRETVESKHVVSYHAFDAWMKRVDGNTQKERETREKLKRLFAMPPSGAKRPA